MRARPAAYQLRRGASTEKVRFDEGGTLSFSLAHGSALRAAVLHALHKDPIELTLDVVLYALNKDEARAAGRAGGAAAEVGSEVGRATVDLAQMLDDKKELSASSLTLRGAGSAPGGTLVATLQPLAVLRELERELRLYGSPTYAHLVHLLPPPTGLSLGLEVHGLKLADTDKFLPPKNVRATGAQTRAPPPGCFSPGPLERGPESGTAPVAHFAPRPRRIAGGVAAAGGGRAGRTHRTQPAGRTYRGRAERARAGGDRAHRRRRRCAARGAVRGARLQGAGRRRRELHRVLVQRFGAQRGGAGASTAATTTTRAATLLAAALSSSATAQPSPSACRPSLQRHPSRRRSRGRAWGSRSLAASWAPPS